MRLMKLVSKLWNLALYAKALDLAKAGERYIRPELVEEWRKFVFLSSKEDHIRMVDVIVSILKLLQKGKPLKRIERTLKRKGLTELGKKYVVRFISYFSAREYPQSWQSSRKVGKLGKGNIRKEVRIY
jgi:hypothetical protein